MEPGLLNGTPREDSIDMARNTLVKGSAVDAAIATLLCLGVVHPQSLGLGGGFLMTVYNRDTGTSQVIDARETAPLASSEDMFAENPDLAKMGGISVAVPGQVRGLWEAHQRYGKLPWRDLFQPAVRLAEEGICIGKHLAIAMRVRKDHILDRKYGLCDVFCDEYGAMLRENRTVRRPQLAKTLLAVANGGADAFYTGEIAEDLVKDIQHNGCGLNPSARDGVYSEVLVYHRMFVALKFSSAHGLSLGDPNFVNVEALTKRMVSKDFADELRHKIDDTRTFDRSYYGPTMAIPDISGTSHVSVLGPNGDAVSVTSSIGRYFGARFRSLSTGIILNNHMELFTLARKNKTRHSSRPGISNLKLNDHETVYQPIHPDQSNHKSICREMADTNLSFNAIHVIRLVGVLFHCFPGDTVQPGKRSRSVMSPTIVLDDSGDVRLVIGGSGGNKLMTALADATVHHLLLSMNISAAIEKPRLHLTVDTGVAKLDYESRRPFKPKAVLHQLAKMHGEVTPEWHQAMVQAVARENSAIFAHSDSRKGGFPAGF
ncbi:glutathione hydrolase 1 proenzyme-like [Branchiostoma lanceolatum]|uniref:glutathione hydrolase 1 proenzyme-like n=1 Tax=Branchiostoma lanceolatum TaxID=7740 RepID=UPI0034542FF9